MAIGAWATWKKGNKTVSVIRIEDISAINEVSDPTNDTIEITWSGPSGTLSVQGVYDSIQEAAREVAEREKSASQ